MLGEPRQLLRAMFDAAIGAASPQASYSRLSSCVAQGAHYRRSVREKRRLRWQRRSKTLWPGPLTGLVVTRYGHAVPCNRIEIVEARASRSR